jgi:hypothetical protein
MQKEITPKNNRMTPAVPDSYLLYAFGWISMGTTCRLEFCPVYTFNGFNKLLIECCDSLRWNKVVDRTDFGKEPQVLWLSIYNLLSVVLKDKGLKTPKTLGHRK